MCELTTALLAMCPAAACVRPWCTGEKNSLKGAHSAFANAAEVNTRRNHKASLPGYLASVKNIAHASQTVRALFLISTPLMCLGNRHCAMSQRKQPNMANILTCPSQRKCSRPASPGCMWQTVAWQAWCVHMPSRRHTKSTCRLDSVCSLKPFSPVDKSRLRRSPAIAFAKQLKFYS